MSEPERTGRLTVHTADCIGRDEPSADAEASRAMENVMAALEGMERHEAQALLDAALVATLAWPAEGRATDAEDDEATRDVKR